MDNLSTHLRLCSSSVYISSFVNYKKFINYKKFAKSTKFGVQCKRSRMGAELEEEELSRIGVEEIFDRSCTDVSDGLREALGGLFHLAEGFARRDDGRSLLEDLLEPALGGAIASV